MSNKTVKVADVLAMVNNALTVSNSSLLLEQYDGRAMTPQEAFRLGQASLLESILHRTDNYAGFSFTDDNRGDTDASRRRYGATDATRTPSLDIKIHY